ncbi:hypothetical protein GNI_067820 [Gregarina niphandrodes]|uniref:Uncharacterized protein n=1 Tax=Gregarina niphandrodes TaxID=110365 RepID=A0A023B7L9_GRENI|nr:hypothetical protein GNI_067820 [Gregarina niphandrodes]EZG67542.1 hypothetical protein GNI_067820 [Gregarina niphandrodes]|eukprot:XP_011130203.1 hypothetical protein GNI_067820 [Gregarina niphandrodes]
MSQVLSEKQSSMNMESSDKALASGELKKSASGERSGKLQTEKSGEDMERSGTLERGMSRELSEGLSNIAKQLSEGDLYKTLAFDEALKNQQKALNARIQQLEAFGELLGTEIEAADKGASLGESDFVIETPHSADIAALREEISDLHQSLLEEIQVQNDALDIIVSKRTEGRIVLLFEQLFEESDRVQQKLEDAQKKCQEYATPDEKTAKKKLKLKKKLDEIKKNTNLLFGCVDVHPEKLYDYNHPDSKNNHHSGARKGKGSKAGKSKAGKSKAKK